MLARAIGLQDRTECADFEDGDHVPDLYGRRLVDCRGISIPVSPMWMRGRTVFLEVWVCDQPRHHTIPDTISPKSHKQ